MIQIRSWVKKREISILTDQNEILIIKHAEGNFFVVFQNHKKVNQIYCDMRNI